MNFGKIASDLLRDGFLYGSKLMPRLKTVEELPKAEFDCIKEPKSTCFTVGFGKTEILPDDLLKRRYYIAGYVINKPAIGVLDAPLAHALWVDDNSGRGGIVFVSIDDVGMLNKDVQAIRDSLADFVKDTGCRGIHIMSTHSHAGIDTMGIWGPLPLTGRDPFYMQVVAAGIRSAVRKAYADRREGDLYLGSVHVPEMQKDHRTPVVYSDVLTRFRFVPKDKSREIYFINFAAHSESLSGSNKLVSADFPGFLRRKIFAETGAETIYAVGAIGGMISMNTYNDVDKPTSTKMIGEKLAGYALSIENERKLKPVLNTMTQEFFFEADNSVLMLAASVGIIKVDKYLDRNAPLQFALKSEMTYMELDDLKIVLLPCELFPELAFGGYLSAEESGTGQGPEVNPPILTEICNDKDLLIFGLANDEVGYVIPPNDFLLDPNVPYLNRGRDRLDRNHYEETNSLGPKTAHKVAEVFEEMYKTASMIQSK